MLRVVRVKDLVLGLWRSAVEWRVESTVESEIILYIFSCINELCSQAEGELNNRGTFFQPQNYLAPGISRTKSWTRSTNSHRQPGKHYPSSTCLRGSSRYHQTLRQRNTAETRTPSQQTEEATLLERPPTGPQKLDGPSKQRRFHCAPLRLLQRSPWRHPVSRLGAPSQLRAHYPIRPQPFASGSPKKHGPAFNLF